jgi:hypothetical protein
MFSIFHCKPLSVVPFINVNLKRTKKVARARNSAATKRYTSEYH